MTTRKKHTPITAALRERYAALTEPTFKLHSELGLKPWNSWLLPGRASLEEAIAEAEGRGRDAQE
jgi:hypothetical protein